MATSRSKNAKLMLLENVLYLCRFTVKFGLEMHTSRRVLNGFNSPLKLFSPFHIVDAKVNIYIILRNRVFVFPKQLVVVVEEEDEGVAEEEEGEGDLECLLFCHVEVVDGRECKHRWLTEISQKNWLGRLGLMLGNSLRKS